MHAAILLAAMFCQFDQFGPGLEMPTSNYDQFGDSPAVEAAPLPVVLVYSIPNCPACETLKRDVPSITRLRFEFRDRPTWTDGKSFPVLHWKGAKGWKSVEGWTGSATFLATYDASLKPAMDAGPLRDTPTHSGYPVRGSLRYGTLPSVYNWPGDLREHLRESPHNLSRDAIAGMTDRQCVQWHDNWHIANAGREYRSEPRRKRGLFGLFRGSN